MNIALRKNWKPQSAIQAETLDSHSLDRAGSTAAEISAPLEVSRVSTLAELCTLEAEWKTLEDRLCDSQLVFQSFDWCSTWSEVFLPVCPHLQLCVFTVRRSGQLLAILPCMIDRTNGLKVLRWLSEPYAQYGGMLCDPTANVTAICSALMDAIANQHSIDLVYLRHVRASSASWSLAATHLHPTGYHEIAPFMDLSAFDTDEAYLARYTKSQRRRRKKISNAISQLGTVTFRKLTSGTEFEKICNHLIVNKRTWIAERGLHTTALHAPQLERFVTELSRREASRLETILSETLADGRSISHELGLRYKGRHCAFITAHDPELTDLSPARLHMDGSQRLALADGMTTFDLMVPGDPYKESWSSGNVAVADFASPLTLRGRLHHTFYLRLLRPIMRKAYLKAPGALRQKAMSAMKVLTRN